MWVFRFLLLCVWVFGGLVSASAKLEDFHFVPLRRYLYFVEDYYSLYRVNLYPDTAGLLANMYYLQKALVAAETNRFWAHPTKSLAYRHYDWANSPLQTGKQYPFRAEDPPFTMAHHAKYRVLMRMHISLLLVKTCLQIASRYDREHIYWFHSEDYEDLPYIKKHSIQGATASTADSQTPKKEHYLLRSFRIAEQYYQAALTHWTKCKRYAKELWDGSYEHKPSKTIINYKAIDLKGAKMDQLESEAYKIRHQNSRFYKQEKHYFINGTHPEYNYDKILKKRLAALQGKRSKVLTLTKLSAPQDE